MKTDTNAAFRMSHFTRQWATSVFGLSLMTWLAFLLGLSVLPFELEDAPIPTAPYICFVFALCGGPLTILCYFTFWLRAESTKDSGLQHSIELRFARLLLGLISIAATLPSLFAVTLIQ